MSAELDPPRGQGRALLVVATLLALSLSLGLLWQARPRSAPTPAAIRGAPQPAPPPTPPPPALETAAHIAPAPAAALEEATPTQAPPTHAPREPSAPEVAHVQALLDAGRAEEALELLNRVLTFSPQLGAAHALRAEALEALGRSEEAQRARDMGMELAAWEVERFQVTGVVLDPDGRPLPDAWLHHPTLPLTLGVEQVHTDAFGRFALELYASTGHHVPVEPLTVGAAGFAVASVPVKLGDLHARIVLALGATLEVTVLDAHSGDPIEGARLSQGGREVVSGVDGRARLDDLGERVRALRVSAPGYVPETRDPPPVAAGETRAFTLRLTPGVRVEGRLRLPNGAPAEAYGRLGELAFGSDEVGAFVIDAVLPGRHPLWIETPTHGLLGEVEVRAGVPLELTLPPLATVILDGLEPGADPRVSVVRRDPGRSDVTQVPVKEGRVSLIAGEVSLAIYHGAIAHHHPLSLAPGEVRHLDLRATAAASTGRVLQPDGAPAGGAWVILHQGGALRGTTIADPEGRFQLEGFAPGRYRVYVRDRARGAALYVPDLALPGSFELTLAPGARLYGRLLGPDGEPLPEFPLFVRSAEHPVNRRLRTDAEGIYDSGELYPGRYTLVAEEADLDLAAQRRGLPSLTLPPTEAELAVGQTVTLTLRVR
ncbi:MAG: carboxypeptidase regulatory-like domain-containing protein [Planctomycetota bacterium]